MISQEETDHLIKLCRLDCSEEEKTKFSQHLEKLLQYIDQLREVDTTGVEPTLHVLDGMETPLREDIEGPTLPSADFFRNAPAQTGGMITVPTVLK